MLIVRLILAIIAFPYVVIRDARRLSKLAK
jgi:hypothetical protein